MESGKWKEDSQGAGKGIDSGNSAVLREIKETRDKIKKWKEESGKRIVQGIGKGIDSAKFREFCGNTKN